MPVEGPVVLFEFRGCGHLSRNCVAVNEVRDAVPWYFSVSGPTTGDAAGLWAAEMLDLVAIHGGGNRRMAIDRVDPQGFQRDRLDSTFMRPYIVAHEDRLSTSVCDDG